MRTPSLLLALTVFLCGAACGPEDDAPGRSRTSVAPHWTPRAREQGTAALALPDARWGAPAPEDGSRPLVLNVFPDGVVVLEGQRWLLGSKEEAERRAAVDGLRSQLVEFSGETPEQGQPSPLPVLLGADREAPWAAVREVLSLLGHPAVGTTEVRWAVRRADSPDAHVTGYLGAEPTPGAPLVIRIASDRREAWTAVRIFSPAGIHSFGPQSTAYANEKFIRRANTTWSELERVLPTLAAEHEGVHLEIKDEQADIWFAYVVKAVDLLFGAGFDEVRLPQVHLVMKRPPGTP